MHNGKPPTRLRMRGSASRRAAGRAVRGALAAACVIAVKDIATTEPWRSLALRNTPGTLPPGIPVFLAQGTADDLVHPAVTQDYMTRLCRAGSKVRMLMLPGVGHGFAGRDSADAAAAWMAERFARTAAPSDCGG
jgi:acetyl esterase/lipase